MTLNNSGIYLFCPKVRWISGGNALLLAPNKRFESFDPQERYDEQFGGLEQFEKFTT